MRGKPDRLHTAKSVVKVRRYDARMVIPLTWNEEGMTECAFVTRVFYRGKTVDQLQLHLIGNLGTYCIDTVCFDSDGSQVEVDVSKMRIFLSDVLFDKESDGKSKRISIPFGKQDCTVFRKVMSTEDTIQDFAPALRTTSQAEAFASPCRCSET